MESPFDEENNRPSISDPIDFTKWTASQKAQAVVNQVSNDGRQPDFVIGADTIVVHQKQIIGKPTDASHAKAILKS